MKSEYLKRLNTEQKIVLWGEMDNIIRHLKSKRIKKYWRETGVPFPLEHKYEDVIVNRYWFEEDFKKCNFDKLWEIFVQCVRNSNI